MDICMHVCFSRVSDARMGRLTPWMPGSQTMMILISQAVFMLCGSFARYINRLLAALAYISRYIDMYVYIYYGYRYINILIY